MKNTKTFKWLLVLACLLAALFAFTIATNAEIVRSGKCGDNLSWTLDDAGTLTISGTGAIAQDAFWEEQSIKSVVIQNGVTSIGTYAFENCQNLVRLTLPDSVTKIEGYAFSACVKLTKVTIPDSVTTIGEGAFYGCTSLTEISISNCLTSIKRDTFSDCTKLSKVTIPNSVTSIDDYAFSDCTGLTEVTIPDGVTSIGMCAFSGCKSLSELTIPNSVTSVGFEAFRDCTKIEKLTIGKIIESVSLYDLVGSKDSLKVVEIIEGATSIGDYMFSDCTNLTEVTFPNSLTYIGTYAFSSCENLADLTIPDSVTYIGSYAFDNTLWLYNQPDGVVLAGKVAIGYKGTPPQDNTLIIPKGTKGIGGSAFHRQNWIKKVILPDGLEMIGDNAFFGLPLTGITLPKGIVKIGDEAFEFCEDITSIIIPNSLKTVGSYAFENCENLSDVYYDGTEEQWKAIAIEKHNLPLSRYAKIHYNHYEHIAGEVVEEAIRAATCTKTGSYDEVTYCVNCGKELSRVTKEQPPIGHNYGVWENLNEKQHQRVCANDKSHVEKENHAWDEGKVTTEPTQTEEGVKTFTCTVCGATKTEPIPKIEPKQAVGDVDGDGKLTSADARLALRASVGLEPDITAGSDAYKAADADGDGKVSSADARLILRASVGLEDPKTFGKKA